MIREQATITCRIPIIISTVILLASYPAAEATENCPRTIGADKVFAEPWPQADYWFGSDALAIVLPTDGIWLTTRPGARIAVKLFWYSAGYEPPLEQDFTGRIERLDDGPSDAVISPPTNALLRNEVWTILTGVDFKSAGCWRITGEYRGQSLEFVVETVEYRDKGS